MNHGLVLNKSTHYLSQRTNSLLNHWDGPHQDFLDLKDLTIVQLELTFAMVEQLWMLITKLVSTQALRYLEPTVKSCQVNGSTK